MSKADPVRILFLHSSADLYGSDQSLLRVVGGLDRKRFAPYVLLPCAGPLVARLQERDIPARVMPLAVFRRRYATFGGLMALGLRALWAVPALVWFIRARRIALVQSNTLAVAAGAVAARLAGISHLWYVREIVEEPAYARKILAFLMLHFASKVLPVSKAVMLHWQEQEPRLVSKMEVVPNGLEDIAVSMEMSEARKELGLSQEGIWVGMIGRINRMKGHGILLEIARGLTKKYSQVRFVCVGDAPAGEEWRREELAEAIVKSGMKQVFLLRKFCQDTEVFYRAVDLIAVPSTAPDALPTVCIEAGFFGKPVVAFDVGGISEIVQDGTTGTCAARGDIAAFRRALEELIVDVPLRETLGRQAREFCLKHFSLSRQIDRLQTLYTQMAP